MIVYKTREQLERDGLTLFPREVQNKSLPDYIFSDPTHSHWQRCGFSTVQYVAKLKAHGHDITDTPLWQRVTDIDGELYCHISNFKPRKDEKKYVDGTPYTYYSFDLLLTTQKNKRKLAKERAMRFKNERVRAFYQMGDPDAPLLCPIEKKGIGVAVQFKRKDGLGLADGHHIVCNGGESIQKEGQDPGKLASTVDFLDATDPRARHCLLDLMVLVMVSKDGHAKIHNFAQSDVDSYDIHELPWTLRCEENYRQFTGWLESHGHPAFNSYTTHMHNLTLGAHGITKGPDYMSADSLLDDAGA